jgi:hypothetical protein
VAVSGINTAPITVYAGPVVRSAYPEQVRRIAPPTLKDRDLELAELAAFCTSGQAVAYVVAGTGVRKSALLSIVRTLR